MGTFSPTAVCRGGIDAYFAELRASGHSAEEIESIRRYGSPVLHQRIDTAGTRAALAGLEGTG